MNPSLLKKSAVAIAVAGLFGATGPAAADVVNLSWNGAFTFLNPTGDLIPNSPSDYAQGFYGVTGAASGPATATGWKGTRTPVSGTMSFDTNTGAGVAAITPFLWFGNNSDNYWSAPNVSFATVGTSGTLVGSMLFSWSLASHSISIVWDASGLLGALPAGPTTTISGVGATPATEGLAGTTGISIAPAQVATKTTNTGEGCDGLSLATVVNATTITRNTANIATCTTGMVDDGVGGDPATSVAFQDFNFNIDILSLHVDSVSAVPIPATVWLFGSGLLGLAGVARRKRRACQAGLLLPNH
jgi:hypothetical protein